MEGVFNHRTLYAEQFRRMNVQLECNGPVVSVQGPSRLRGATVSGHDIRACASLLLLALAAEERRSSKDWQHLKPGL